MRVAKIRLAPILGVVIAAALCTGAWPALAGEPAQVAKKKKLTCKRLKKSKDLAPARKVRLVRRRNRDGGTDLLGCVLPKGTVRLVASSANQTTREGYSLRQVAGAVVLIDASSGNQYATSRGTSVFNIRTGKSYSVARSCFGSPCSSTGVTAASAFVNKLGQATAALASQDEAPPWVMAPQHVTISGFSASGRRTVLDAGPAADIPASSLRLVGSTVTWTHSGQQRTAQLSG